MNEEHIAQLRKLRGLSPPNPAEHAAIDAAIAALSSHGVGGEAVAWLEEGTLNSATPYDYHRCVALWPQDYANWFPVSRMHTVIKNDNTPPPASQSATPSDGYIERLRDMREALTIHAETMTGAARVGAEADCAALQARTTRTRRSNPMTTPNNTVAGLAEKLRAMLDDVDAVKLRPEGFVQGVRALLALASPAPSAGVGDDAIKAAAMRCARHAYGFWRGGSNGSCEALQYFDGGYVGRERDAAMYEAEIRAALQHPAVPSAPPSVAGDAGELPELPPPVPFVSVFTEEYGTRDEEAGDDYYTADQMRAYGQLCRNGGRP